MKNPTRYFITDLVAEVGSLPSLAARVVSLAADPLCDMSELARLILSDNVLTMRFLALANSASFSRGQETRDLPAALVRLGLRRVRNVALLMGLHDMTPRRSEAGQWDPNAFWLHSLAVACCAQGLARDAAPQGQDDAWLAGILHGLGLNLLHQQDSAALDQVLAAASRQRTTLATAEMEILGFHHGELAARVLRDWNLPGDIADAVEMQPEEFGEDEVSPAAARLIRPLRQAITLARIIGYGACGDADPIPRLSELTEQLGWPESDLANLATTVDQQVRDLSDLIGLQPTADLFSRALVSAQAELARLGLAGLDEGLINEELAAQLAAAREIQTHILPRAVPEIPGYAVAATNYPSRQVSGDTYDFLAISGRLQGFAIADVAGKGMPAALLASTLQASLRALSQIISDPGTLLGAANGALYASTDDERFATVFLAVLDPASGRLQYASAGHNPPLLQRATGDQEWLMPAGPPLGMMSTAEFPVSAITLAPGDAIVAYTDGVTEATDDTGGEFAREGLARVVANAGDCGPAYLLKKILTAVGARPGSADPVPSSGTAGPELILDAEDDLSLIILRRQP